jgi:hypothetical protein
MRKPPERLEPDERWQLLVGSYGDLVAAANSWVTRPDTKPQVAEMLKTCQALFAHSYFVYEFGPVAVVWSVLAVEAALRDKLGNEATQDDGLSRLIGKAQGRGWFSAEQAEALRAGAELRNRLSHARTYGVFTAAQVAGALETAHELVARLYET